MKESYLNKRTFYKQIRALVWKNMILKKRSWIGIIIELLLALKYILFIFLEADDHILKIRDYYAQPLIGMGLTMFPIY